MKDYPEELQKAAGSRHQKWKYPKTFPLQQLYRMMLNMSDYGQRQRIKYSESIMLRKAVQELAGGQVTAIFSTACVFTLSHAGSHTGIVAGGTAAGAFSPAAALPFL